MAGAIPEVPCVVARVEDTVHLVIRLADLPAAAPARSLVPGSGGRVILLTPGEGGADFGWTGGAPGPDEMHAGVAAALAARLHGMVLPEPWLRGARTGARRCYEFAAARPDWWCGSWSVRPACPGRAGRVRERHLAARLLLHGEIVLT